MEYKKKKEIIKQFYAKGFPILEAFEAERKRRLRKMMIIESILVIIYAAFLCNKSLIEAFLNNNVHAHMAACLCLLAILAYPYLIISGFTKDLKSKVMPIVMNSVEQFRYLGRQKVFSVEELLESTLFSSFNQIYADDSFCGKIGGVNCKISEVRLKLSDVRYTFISFRGVVAVFDFNKKINAKTIVTSTNDINVKNNLPFMTYAFIVPVVIAIPFVVTNFFLLLFFGMPLFLLLLVAIVLQHDNKKKFQETYDVGKKQINLEDTKFSKRFRVYSNDEVEARYLITPSFMERFLNLTTSFGSKKAKCAFYDNKVIFAISTRKNLFEFGSLFKPLDNPKDIGFFNEIFSILDMIDYFKLDEKTGL